MVSQVVSHPTAAKGSGSIHRVLPLLALTVVVLLTFLVWMILPHWTILTLAGTREP